MLADSQLRGFSKAVISSNLFNAFIIGVIILNGILIGVQTYPWAPIYVHYIQLIILLVFFGEILLRWWGRESTAAYISDGWNWFDIIILLVGVAPEVADIVMHNSGEDNQNGVLATLRVLRVVQLTRSIRAVDELKVMISVLIRSIRSLSYIALLFILVTYIYAVVGVMLFKDQDYNRSEHLEITKSNPDPYGDLGEAFFTLFRMLTAEDWTDVRYNLLEHEHTVGKHEPGLVGYNSGVTIYHVSWMMISTYLLINLVIGAVVNNFQDVIDERNKREKLEKEQQNSKS